MFPVTRDMLFYMLAFLGIVMVVLIALIVKKRGVPGKPGTGEEAKAVPAPKPPKKEKAGKRDEGDEEKPALPETGPTDAHAIKDKLKSDREVPEAPAPAPPIEPERHEPAEAEPVFEEGVIEQGMEMEEAADVLVPPKEEPAPAEEAAETPPVPEDTVGFVDLEGYEEYKGPPKEAEKAPEKPPEEKDAIARAVPKPEVRPIKALEPRTTHEADFSYKKVEGVKPSPPIDTETLAKSSKDFIGQTISIEGDLHLSSKGKDDVWYSLFDTHGSAVVRSKEEIPHERCRLEAVVKQTRLGQIYLEVVRHEKV